MEGRQPVEVGVLFLKWKKRGYSSQPHSVRERSSERDYSRYLIYCASTLDCLKKGGYQSGEAGGAPGAGFSFGFDEDRLNSALNLP